MVAPGLRAGKRGTITKNAALQPDRGTRRSDPPRHAGSRTVADALREQALT
jgi:hypothetical protein